MPNPPGARQNDERDAHEIETLREQQRDFEKLKKIVCSDHPHADVCKSN